MCKSSATHVSDNSESGMPGMRGLEEEEPPEKSRERRDEGDEEDPGDAEEPLPPDPPPDPKVWRETNLASWSLLALLDGAAAARSRAARRAALLPLASADLIAAIARATLRALGAIF